MKKILICILMIVLFSCPAFAGMPEYIEGEVLVVLNAPMSVFSVQGAAGANDFSDALTNQAEAFASEFELEVLNTFSEIARISGVNIIHLRSEYQSTEELIQELSAVSYVESVSPNCIRYIYDASTADTAGNYDAASIVPNDPYYSQQWNMKAIEMEEAWGNVTGSDTVCVAVLDTGIDYNHPDISANMARDSFGNYGRYFKNGAEASDPMDRDGHGTHVAGIIGAVGNNGIGVTGINWRVKMLAVNVMANRTALDADVIKGINYVVSEKQKGLNIRVANMSFGGWDVLADNSSLGMAVKSLSDAGIICTMAVGNDYESISSPGAAHRNQKVYPACFRFDNTISVGSISYGNGKSSFSNFSTEWVDIAAPGDQIYSTNFSDRYGTLTGTSMAAPHVAGAAALMMAARPAETPAQIKTRILSGAKKIGISEGYWKYGVLDVAGAYHYSGVNVPVTGVVLNKTTMQLGVGEAETLFPIISPNNATNRNVAWKSSNTTVAEVSTGGLVTAKNIGSATITVTTSDSGRTANCSVTVTQAGSIIHPTSVQLDKMSMTIPLGGSGVLVPTIIPENATNKQVEWSSSNVFSATVSDGIVYAGERPGTAVITVRTVDGGFSKQCTVTVISPVTRVFLNKHETTIGVGEEELLEATVEPYNATYYYNLIWSSSNEAVATVTQGGLVVGKGGGTTTVTVKAVDGEFADNCVVNVTGTLVAVSGVTLDKQNISLNAGESELLTETVAPPNASNKNVTWSSSNEAVATVVNGTVTGVSEGPAIVTVKTVDGNYTAMCSVTVSKVITTIPVSGVTLNKQNMTLTVGGSEQLTATIAPSNATNKNMTWSSSNAAVAVVSNGQVFGMSVGDAVITVKTEDGDKTATCLVTVSNIVDKIPVSGVALNKQNMTLLIGGSEQLTETVAPPDATNKNVTWSSSNEAVATVSGGLVTGVSEGSATVTVKTADGDKTATCLVTVTKVGETIPVSGVTLDNQNMTLIVKSSEQLTATVEPANATNKNVTWSSSNEAVAMVSGGYVFGVSEGTATITVRTVDGDKTATCIVTVNRVAVTGVTLNKRSTIIRIGETETLTVTVKPANVSNKDVVWGSDNNEVASVSDGVVTGEGLGTTTIRVMTVEGGFRDGCSVTVSSTIPVPVTGITVDKAEMTVKVGQTGKLTFTVQPENATNKNFSIDSSAPEIAVVNSEGVVTGISVGITTITAYTDDGYRTVESTVTVSDDVPPPDDSVVLVENPKFAENKSDTVQKIEGFSEDDLDISDGKVVIKKSIAEKIFRDLKSDEDMYGVSVVPLPYFEAEVGQGRLAAVKFPMKGSNIRASKPEIANLLKILTPTTGKLLQYASREDEYSDGKFTILKVSDGKPLSPTSPIVADGKYEVVLFIRDGGEYDLDKKENGYVIDPAAIVRKIYEGERGLDDDEGGCNAGFGSISLLLAGLALFTIRRKK